MSEKDNVYLMLQNGSDIRGFALDTPEQKKNLTAESIRRIADGFASWLEKDQSVNLEHAVVAVGHDSRVTGAEIKENLTERLVAAGVTVFDVGMATTPAMFMSTQYSEYDCDASIMITASHLPMEYNGLKFFTRKGGLEHEDITDILTYAGEGTVPAETVSGKVVQKDLIADYAADLREKIRAGLPETIDKEQPLKGRHIIVDAGNGAGGFFVDQVLEPLGADTTGSQFLDPDGTFPNHVPNPDNKEAMASIQQAVLESKADLGIIFDTDADRSAIVDEEGNSINRNNLIGLIGAVVLKEEPGATIVTNSPVSNHLENFIASLGGKVDRYISGYRNVINRGVELNERGVNCPLAIETSGHAALRENYFLDDGAYLVAKLLIADAILQEEGSTLTDLIRDLKQPVETQEVRFVIRTADYKETGERTLQAFSDFATHTPGMEVVPNNKEGIRVNTSGPLGEGWMLLRMSLHEPKLVLQIESDEEGKIPFIRSILRTFFEVFEAIDSSKL